MNSFRRQNYIYTAGFCEENIWCLLRSLGDDGLDIDAIKVLFFSNTEKNILLMNQRIAEPGKPVLWDYHVVLVADINSHPWVFDFDTRLEFPVKLQAYTGNTFPQQDMLPQRYRGWMRIIPADIYYRHFYSDRTHMLGVKNQDEFPDYPIIQPTEGDRRILLSQFWDMQHEIEGCEVIPVNRL